MFGLKDWTPEERHLAANICSVTYVYLLQCGSGVRSPGTKLAEKLINFDRRLTLTALLEPKRKRDAHLKKQARKQG